jgi:hypothetical protein
MPSARDNGSEALTGGPQNGLRKNAPDHTAGDHAHVTGDDQPGSRSRGSANPVGARARRGHNGQHIRCQDEIPQPGHPAFTTDRYRKPSLGHGSGMRERFTNS